MIRNKKGFTIIELLIAMTAFTSMALLASLTILQIGRMYYKGVTSIDVQDATRNTASVITEQLQFSKGEIKTGDGGDFKSYCVGDNRYSYILDRIQKKDVPAGPTGFGDDSTRHALWYDKMTSSSTCTPLDPRVENPSDLITFPGSGRDLLGENMRLTDFVIENINPSDQFLVRLIVGVIYGDNDLIDRTVTPPVCSGSVVGSQWCAKSRLETQVYRLLPE